MKITAYPVCMLSESSSNTIPWFGRSFVRYKVVTYLLTFLVIPTGFGRHPHAVQRNRLSHETCKTLLVSKANFTLGVLVMSSGPTVLFQLVYCGGVHVDSPNECRISAIHNIT